MMTLAIGFAAWLAAVVPVLALLTSRSNHRAGPDPADLVTQGRTPMHAAWEWQAMADDSLEHRNPTDADVADHICNCRHDAELLRLEDGRDLSSLWERS